jgi:hypothetical protein
MKCARKWAMLPYEQKEKYKKKALDDKVRFQ